MAGWAVGQRRGPPMGPTPAIQAGFLGLDLGQGVAIGSTIVARSSWSRSPFIDPSSASAVTRAASAAMTRAPTAGATVA
jgi:hypothetical protein